MVLAQQIQTHTSFSNDYLLPNNLPSLGLGVDAKHTADLPERISVASRIILNATEELNQLVLDLWIPIASGLCHYVPYFFKLVFQSDVACVF